MKTFEVNFDGLIGPTHNYAGLSLGNVASMGNKQQISNPKEAALQGLEKMKALVDLGFKQGVLAPQPRPCIKWMRQLGFRGKNESEILADIGEKAPELLAAFSSASSMWTANAATVSPSADTIDGKVHITPANLVNKLHRFIEPQMTAEILKKTFSGSCFVHHDPLPSHESFGDEGAANHTRFCSEYGKSGLELFVYGRYADLESGPHPKRYPARQTLEASEAIARLHQLDLTRTIFAQQNPQVIDGGVFHNDVISVGNKNCLFYHEDAFLDFSQLEKEILQAWGDEEFHFVKVSRDQVSVQDAVQSYLFNSQLLSTNHHMVLLVPEESRRNENVWRYLSHLVEDKSQPIQQVIVKDVKQSMKNGGGPACLRLRVVLTESELEMVNPATLLDHGQYENLKAWIERHYRDRLAADDLKDPLLWKESQAALIDLAGILNLGDTLVST